MIQKLKNIAKIVAGIENQDLILSDQLQIPLKEATRLRKKADEKNRTSVLFGSNILTTNNFWYLHSLKEIFLDEVYRFKTNNKQPRIIDCGANIGLSLVYFHRNYPGSSLIAFESDPYIFNILEENTKTFKINNATLWNYAVWNEESTLEFNSSGDLGGSLMKSSTHPGNTLSYLVKSIRLKDYLNEPTDMLKLDIEGAEVIVLRDIRDSLDMVSNIFIEYHSSPDKEQELDEIITILKYAGYRIYIKEAWNNMQHPFMHSTYKPYWDLQLNIFGYRP